MTAQGARSDSKRQGQACSTVLILQLSAQAGRAPGARFCRVKRGHGHGLVPHAWPGRARIENRRFSQKQRFGALIVV
jgi:hypothetical protein